MPQLKTKTGRLTRYALACGYIECTEREQSYKDRVTSLYRDAVHFKIPADRVREKAQAMIWNSEGFKRLPSYRRYAVQAVYQFLFHGPADLSIYQHLEYRMLYKSIYYSDFNAWRAQFPDANAAEIETGHHFYKGTNEVYA